MRDLSEILDDVLNTDEFSKAKATGEKKGLKVEDVAHDACDLIRRLATDLSPVVTFQVACSAITALKVHHKVMIGMAEAVKKGLQEELMTEEYQEPTIELADEMNISYKLAAIQLLDKVHEGTRLLEADAVLLGQALETMTKFNPGYPKPPNELGTELVDELEEGSLRSIREKEGC